VEATYERVAPEYEQETMEGHGDLGNEAISGVVDLERADLLLLRNAGEGPATAGSPPAGQVGPWGHDLDVMAASGHGGHSLVDE